MLSENAKVILSDRYLLPGETPEQLWSRVATAVAAAEPEKDREYWGREFYDLMANLKFLPNSPAIRNAGTKQGCLSACFVISPDDNMESIMQIASDAAMILKWGGGVGFGLSKLRPRGDTIQSTHKNACGPVAVMKLYSRVSETITQGSFRLGALMAQLSCSHPDILEFIHVKDEDNTLHNFNISVQVTEEFMGAVKNNSSWELINPRNGEIVKTIDARALWNEICESAWKTGDPGVVFIDKIRADDPNPHFGGINSSNPCQPSFATVLTPNGIRTFGEVEIGDTIWSGNRWTKIVNKIATGEKPVYCYRTTFGSFIGTKNHRIVSEGEKVEVGNAESIDSNVGDISLGGKWDAQAIIDGLVIGDGSVKQQSGRNWRYMLLYIGENDQDYFNSEVSSFINPQPFDKNSHRVETSIAPQELPKTYERTIPERYYLSDGQTICAFLRGLYSANGSICDNRVTLKATSFALVEQVQQMLSAIGIRSYYTTNKAHEVQFSNGIYLCKESYDLSITRDRQRFNQLIGFIQGDKQRRLNDACKTALSPLKTQSCRIVSVEELGEMPVFDITVEAEEHTYWTGGMLVSNCGEIFESDYESCNLGSLNLSNFYQGGSFRYDEFVPAISTSIRFLDDIVTINKFPLPKLAEMNARGRRIGLGVMGWADLLLKMGIPYDSEEAIQQIREIGSIFQHEAWETSARLAKEKGAFPDWEQSTLPKKLNDSRPMRNACVTAIAPTGTISRIAGCSSGIEPHFAVAWESNVLWKDHLGTSTKLIDAPGPILQQLAHMNGDLQPFLKKIIQYPRAAFELLEKEGVRTNAIRTSHQISPEWHVRMQAEWQKYVSNSISKCIAAGTLVPTTRGLIPIEDFSEIEKDDTFVHLDGTIKTAEGYSILSHYKAGLKAATTIHLDNGSSLTAATESHKVMTADGWEVMKNLKVGDIILGRFAESHGQGGEALEWADIYRSNAKKIKRPTQMTPDFAEFLGILCADGILDESTGFVGICCKEEEKINEFVKLVRAIFQEEPSITIDKRNDVKSIYLTSRNLCRFIISLVGKGAYEKHAPLEILRGSKEEKLSFLRGVSFDGFLTPSYGLCVYGGMSKVLAYQIAEMCRSFGLPKVYQGRKQVVGSSREGAVAYHVIISGELQGLVECVQGHKNSLFPTQVDFKVYVQRSTLGDVHIKSDHPHYSAFKALLADEQRRYCYYSIAKSIGLPVDILAFRITAIEDAGMVELYDIEVDESHEYVINGMISHNTTNLPFEADVEVVRKAYKQAWASQCKSITIYRDGSKSMQVLQTGESRNSKKEQPIEVKPKVLGDKLRGERIKIATGFGKMYVNINYDEDDKPVEVFINIGKTGGATASFTEAIGRLISMSLRANIPLKEVIHQLDGIACQDSIWHKGQQILSVPDGIAKALGLAGDQCHILPQRFDVPQEPTLDFAFAACPNCGGRLHFSDGCRGGNCLGCGYSKCS